MTIGDLLAERDHVFLDFDGPVCAVFGQSGDRAVAAHLKVLVGPDVPANVANASDPFDVLHYAASCGPAMADAVEQQFRQLEVEAVSLAPPTTGIEDVVKTLTGAGFTVTIVSNNSVAAVRAFLALHGLEQFIRRISARSASDPGVLKPNPFLVNQAIRALGTTPGLCVMVGDSVADVDAAHAAGIPIVGYANKPSKLERLRAHGADATIESMAELATATATT